MTHSESRRGELTDYRGVHVGVIGCAKYGGTKKGFMVAFIVTCSCDSMTFGQVNDMTNWLILKKKTLNLYDVNRAKDQVR